MSGSCPYCKSTDIGHTMKGMGICLDCEQTWTPGGKKRRGPRPPTTPSTRAIEAMVRDMGRRS